MKTKEEIIEIIKKIKGYDIGLKEPDYDAVLHYLSEPTLNLNRIDEERLLSIWRKSPSTRKTIEIIKEYNSTLPEIKQLEPLPSKMPDFMYWHERKEKSSLQLWQHIVSKYCTPKREELPNVEELRKEIVSIYQKGNASKGFLHHIAQHLIDKYSLPKREWWMDLKEGEKFGYKNKTMTFDSLDRKPKIFVKENGWVYADDCTPYVEPNTREKLLATMTDEQKELLKQWEAERC